ncbi:hypothetical protein MTR67_000832 [Solanum verrucosum]|uniref:Chromo domain-containing protein n=1 Tax=Solanum verrucosum TaxID=315347 RepID=A0AAF0T4I4_SOLVR|nr:hypothetical protein MTR67_000832 [Solanum verrucosum]
MPPRRVGRGGFPRRYVEEQELPYAPGVQHQGEVSNAVHPVFHISMLKKCICDPLLILPTESVRIKDSLSYEEIPVQILDRQVRRLRTKEVASVKVFWRNQFVEEATWEAEEDMKKRYPHLFESGGNADQDIVSLSPPSKLEDDEPQYQDFFF